MNLFAFFGITFLYKSSISRKIVSSILIYAISMVCDAFILGFSTLTGLDSLIFTQGVAASILVFILALILKHITAVFKKDDKGIKINIVYVLAIVLIPTSSIIIGQLSMKGFDLSTIIIAGLLFLINFAVFFLYDNLLKMMKNQHKAKLIEQVNKEYASQIKIMYQAQNRLKFLRHDMKNHIIKMQTLLSDGSYEELKEYLNKTSEYMIVDKQYVATGNADTDSLLNYKLYQAESEDISVHTDITIPEHLNIDSFDMNIILGNLLDNALEALKKVEDKQLDIVIKYNKGVINMKISNTFDGTINEPMAEPEENSEHGLGLLSIQSVLDKYSGILKTSHENNCYKAAILMYEK